MEHEKCDDASDDHQQKSGINDPHAGIIGYLKACGVPGLHFGNGYGDIPFSHFIKTGEFHRQYDFNGLSGCRLPCTNKRIADIMPPELKTHTKIRERKCSQALRNRQGLADNGFFQIFHASGLADKTEYHTRPRNL